MTKKKSKFWTFCWSLIPGAGEMYLGFFKQGINLMSLFFILLGISGFLQMGFLTFLTPIIWFFSFFHTNNLNSLPDEEFYSMEDDYFIHWDIFIKNQVLIEKHRRLLSICLILFGISIFWNTFSRLFFYYLLPNLSVYLPDELIEPIHYTINSVPQFIVAFAVILSGVYLIKGKREELKKENPNSSDSSDAEKKE